MALKIEIDADIPEQIFEICEKRDGFRLGLGDEVELEIYRIFDRIEDNPKQFPKIRKDIRRALIKKFSLSIFFIVFEEKDVALILDILPQSSGQRNRWPE